MISILKQAVVICIASILLILICCPRGYAEKVTLNSGRVFEGVIMDYSDEGITLKDGDKIFKVKYRMMEKIEKSKVLKSSDENLEGALDRLDKYYAKFRKRDEDILNRIKEKQVDFYMAPWCPVCHRAERFFKEHGVNYNKHNIDLSIKARKEYESLGAGGIPLIKIGDKILRGFSPSRLWNTLTAK